MIAAFSKFFAAVTFEVPEQIAKLHAAFKAKAHELRRRRLSILLQVTDLLQVLTELLRSNFHEPLPEFHPEYLLREVLQRNRYILRELIETLRSI